MKEIGLVKACLVDPVTVARIALQDAASVAGRPITTEAMVADRSDRKSVIPAMPGGDVDF